MVAALELLLANGSLVTLSPTQHPEIFDAARVSLGTLGVITRVTLRIVPAFLLEKYEKTLPVDSIIENIDKYLQENLHFQFWWVPNTELGRITTMNPVKSSDITATSSARGDLQRWLDNELSMRVFSVLLRILSPFPSAWGFFLRNVLLTVIPPEVKYIDRSDRVLLGGYPDCYSEMEYFFPLETGVKVLQDFRDLLRNRPDLHTDMPFNCRFVQKDDIWLSPNYGRDSFVCGLLVYDNLQEWVKIAVEYEKIAIRHQGRPHWGKCNYQTAHEYRPLFPKFQDFLKLREEVDPNKVFVNDYVNRVLLQK